MDIEKIAQKLGPLLPDKVQHWLRIKDTADVDMRALVDNQIRSAAYRVLGDFRGKILLSLPPKKHSQGKINLGTVLYDTEKWPFGISYTELMQNLAIFGRSGGGKTNAAFHILEQLDAQKIPFLFFDWKRTARHLIPRLRHKVNIYTPGRSLAKFSFNPFITPPGLDVSVYITQVIDVMASAFTLGDGAKSILQKALLACYDQGNHAPLASEIIEQVDKIPSKERVRGWKISALRALETIEFSNMIANKTSQQEMAEGLINESTIIELDGLGQNAKKFLIPLLYQWVYQVKLASQVREKLSLVIFLEEAHHVLYRQEQRSGETLVEMLLRQCREIGIGTVIIDQHPHLISSVALGNSFTSISLNLKTGRDINQAAGFSLVDKEDKDYFSMLPVGQGIVKLQDRWRKPVLIQFPLVPVKKGLITDDILARYSALSQAKRTGSGRKTSVLPVCRQVPRVPLYDSPLQEPAFALLDDVLRHQDDGVKVRYKRLSLSAGTGNRLKEQLLGQGWLQDQVVDLGRTRKLLLRVTKQGKKALGLDSENPERASLVHEYWKRYYAQRYREMGYEVQVEAPRQNGNVDVLAVKDEKSIAIEIETGKSDIISNVKQNLLSRYTHVYVVATDDKALKKVVQELGRAGLMISGKVDVILQDGDHRRKYHSI